MNLSETHVLTAAAVLALLAPASVTATANETGVAVGAAARGHAAAVLTVKAASAGTNPTFDFKLQSSEDNSTNWTDVPGASASQVTTVDSYQVIPFLPGAVQKYIRAVVTIGGTSSPAFTAAASLVYWPAASG